MPSFTSMSRKPWRWKDRRKTRKFVTIPPVLDPNRELPAPGRPPGGAPEAPGEGPVQQLFHEQQPAIQKAAAYFCRRYGFSREEIEDFTQHVLLKIWADDCAVLRKYQGRDDAKMTTYLAVVVHRALLDYVDGMWGKWRPSAQARRLGQLAVDLERLLVCDRSSLDEACQTLRSRGVTATNDELSTLAARLPQPRVPRRTDAAHESDGRLAPGAGGARRLAAGAGRAEPAAAESADDLLVGKERQRCRQMALKALKAALAALPDEDRLIARMVGEVPIADIARIWKLDQKALYKRRDKILRSLRQALEGAGVRAEDVGEFLGHVDT